MPILFGIIALLFPRVLILVLWLFTNWFSGVVNNILYLLLGFLFVPLSTLWYGVVIHYFGGDWTAIPLIGMVVTVILDLGGWRSSRKLL